MFQISEIHHIISKLLCCLPHLSWIKQNHCCLNIDTPEFCLEMVGVHDLASPHLNERPIQDISGRLCSSNHMANDEDADEEEDKETIEKSISTVVSPKINIEWKHDKNVSAYKRKTHLQLSSVRDNKADVGLQLESQETNFEKIQRSMSI